VGSILLEVPLEHRFLEIPDKSRFRLDLLVVLKYSKFYLVIISKK
jgi:hypothetical protein